VATTIEQLEAHIWPKPEPGATFLIRRCSELRRKSLSDRIMLGQREAVAVLLPRAVDLLVRDPLAEGDLYPGDLLVSVLRLPDASWSGLHVERHRLERALRRISGSGFGDPELRQQVADFLGDPDRGAV
jgi:CDI immunity proteins